MLFSAGRNRDLEFVGAHFVHSDPCGGAGLCGIAAGIKFRPCGRN
jgi:hypothetical protein